jgi:hypothetical protein
MALAIAVRKPKQVDKLLATLYSPPETWSVYALASAKGMIPGSRRVTKAPRAKRSWADPAAAGIDKDAIIIPPKI